MHTGLQNVRGWYTRFCAYTRQKGRDPLGSTACLRSSRDHSRSGQECDLSRLHSSWPCAGHLSEILISSAMNPPGPRIRNRERLVYERTHSSVTARTDKLPRKQYLTWRSRRQSVDPEAVGPLGDHVRDTLCRDNPPRSIRRAQRGSTLKGLRLRPRSIVLMKCPYTNGKAG